MVGSVSGFGQQPVSNALQPGIADNSRQQQTRRGDGADESTESKRADGPGPSGELQASGYRNNALKTPDKAGDQPRQDSSPRGSLVDITV